MTTMRFIRRSALVSLWVGVANKCAGAFPVPLSLPKTLASAEDLQQLVHLNKRRKVGSLKYVAGWRHWSQLAIDTMRFHLSENIPHAVDHETFRELLAHLGPAADHGHMPSFENPGSRSGYALDFFCRSRMLADLLLDIDQNPTVSFTNFSTPVSGTCNVVSIGGGPGFDHVGISLLASFYNSYQENPVTIRTTVFDYEEGWHDLVTSMGQAALLTLPDQPHSLLWGGTCDITKSMCDSSNIACLQLVASTDLFICQYCVAENAHALQASKFGFFRHLFCAARPGAVFVITETTPRLWPAFTDLADSTKNMEVSFVRNLGRGKSGPHMILRKTTKSSAPMTDLERQEYRHYQELARLHQNKLDNDWKRQKRKSRGSKLAEL